MPPFGSLFFLVIEHAVAVALEIGVLYLLTELSAHALVFLGLLTAARVPSDTIFTASFFCRAASSVPRSSGQAFSLKADKAL